MMMRISSRVPEIESSLKAQLLLLAGVIVVAGILRFYKLGQWSFWIDELYTIERIQAHYSTLQATLRNVPPHTNWIPVSLLFISGLLDSLGVSEWSARLGPAIIGILSIPILYVPVKKIFGARVALISALLLAVSPWHLYWSQNARFYTALMLFYTLALLAIYLGLERDRPLYILLGLLFSYLAASERIFALFLAPVVGSYLLLVWFLPFENPAGLNRKNLFILSLPVIAGLAIEAASLLTSGVSRFFGDFGWFFLYRNMTPPRLVGAIVFSIGLVLMTLALFGGYYLIRQKSRPALLLSISAVLPILLVLPLSTFMFTKDRYVFITLPTWIILASVAVNAVSTRLKGQQMLLGAAVLSLLLADAAQNNLLYYRSYEGNRRDWRGAFALVREQAHEGDAVVAFWPEFGPYYLDREIIAWDDIERQEIVEMDRRIWFVVDSETVWGDLRKKAWIEENADLIDVFYLRTPGEQSIRVYLYDPTPSSPEG
jgi:uncharacterized membrane protein